MTRAELLGLLNLSEELIAAGRPNRSGRRITPTSVTVHNTSNDNVGADAAAHSRFVRQTGFYMHNGRQNWVSWHYSVDDRRVIRHLPIREEAFHAGPANRVSLAIEVCMNRGIDQAAADLRAARLVALHLFDLRLGRDDIRTHKSWTGKACPTLLMGQWDRFVDHVMEIRNAITGPPPPADAVAGGPREDFGDTDGIEIDHDALAAALARQ